MPIGLRSGGWTGYPACPDCKAWEQEVRDLEEHIAHLKIVKYEDDMYYEEQIQDLQKEVKRLNKRLQLLVEEEENDL